VQQNWKGLLGISTVGLEFGLSILVGMLAGRWADRRLGTAHWLTFVGFAIGVVAGYRTIYRALQRANREAEREAENERVERRRYHDDHDEP
jgi:F0F1-type ATP synthase assembly protein I